MHPALSVIIFTTFSGMGYGLFIWLCLTFLMGGSALSGNNVVIASAASFILVSIGLISSMLHLGHPERAWRAFSQWRTSWLSREGVMAIITFGPITFIAANAFLNLGLDNLLMPVALLGIICAVITLFTTSMIYASLKAIPAWHNKWVIIGFQVYALSSGGIAYLTIFGFEHAGKVALLLLIGIGVKIATWVNVDKNRGKYSREEALGLTDFGTAKPFEPAHSQKNYLNREMGYDLCPQKRILLRWTALAAGFIIPAILSLIGFEVALLTAVTCLLGMMAERWLFFAEAEHVVRLYYDREVV